jgi:hypothetical protein
MWIKFRQGRTGMSSSHHCNVQENQVLCTEHRSLSVPSEVCKGQWGISPFLFLIYTIKERMLTVVQRCPERSTWGRPGSMVGISVLSFQAEEEAEEKDHMEQQPPSLGGPAVMGPTIQRTHSQNVQWPIRRDTIVTLVNPAPKSLCATCLPGSLSPSLLLQNKKLLTFPAKHTELIISLETCKRFRNSECLSVIRLTATDMASGSRGNQGIQWRHSFVLVASDMHRSLKGSHGAWGRTNSTLPIW